MTERSMSDKTLNIELTVDQANLILEALGRMPYIRVYQLIQQIQEQSAAQLQTPSAPDPNDPVGQALARLDQEEGA